MASLALEATEKVAGKVLTEADQRRLIEEAIDELDFSALEKDRLACERRRPRVRPALYDAALERGNVAEVQQLAAVAEAMAEVPQLRSVIGNPQIDAGSKAAVLEAAAGEPDGLVSNFLKLVAEKGAQGRSKAFAPSSTASWRRPRGSSTSR